MTNTIRKVYIKRDFDQNIEIKDSWYFDKIVKLGCQDNIYADRILFNLQVSSLLSINFMNSWTKQNLWAFSAEGSANVHPLHLWINIGDAKRVLMWIAQRKCHTRVTMRFDTIYRVGVIGESKIVNLLLGGDLGEEPVFITTFMKRQLKFKKKKIKVELW